MLNVTYAKCHLCCMSLMLNVTYVECHTQALQAECHFLSVVMLCVFMLSVVKLYVFMLNVTYAECHLR
jgi:hypothetical protein